VSLKANPILSSANMLTVVLLQALYQKRKIVYYWFSLRAAPAVLSMQLLKKYFSHPSLVIYSNLSHKTKTGTAKINGRLLRTNHVNQSLWSANQKQGATIRSCLLHFSLAGAAQLSLLFSAAPWTNLCKLCKRWQGANHVDEPNQHVLTFRSVLLCTRRSHAGQPWGML